MWKIEDSVRLHSRQTSKEVRVLVGMRVRSHPQTKHSALEVTKILAEKFRTLTDISGERETLVMILIQYSVFRKYSSDRGSPNDYLCVPMICLVSEIKSICSGSDSRSCLDSYPPLVVGVAHFSGTNTRLVQRNYIHMLYFRSMVAQVGRTSIGEWNKKYVLNKQLLSRGHWTRWSRSFLRLHHAVSRGLHT